MKKCIIFLAIICCALSVSAQNWYQVGFRVGTCFTTTRDYSTVEGIHLNGLTNADFGVYFRAGKYVYGEVGLSYAFFKGDYTQELITGYVYQNVRVETRYLQIPVKAVGYIPFGKTSAVMPYAGIIYQPLVGVTDNEIGFSKNTLNKNMLYATGGLELKFGPIVFGCDYRYSFQSFFKFADGQHPQYVHISAGFQF